MNIKKSKEVGERQEKKKTIIVGERVVRERKRNENIHKIADLNE